MAALTRQDIEQATGRLQRVIDEVCGACKLNCCLQGTMVGSDDARRVAKAARLSPAFRERLIEGLRQRGAQLRRDLEGLERTARLAEARFGAEKPAEVGRLRSVLKQWREFCDFLEQEFTPEPQSLLRCLVFSGIRATALRAMRAFPGGESVVPALAGAGTSFQSGRRGIKADRCLFHVEGCIIPTAKPHKCADFYCAGDPGLINEIVDRLSFDEFTLAHFVPYGREPLLKDLELELEMGRAFFEPKVIVGGHRALAEAVAERMGAAFREVRMQWIEGGHLDPAVDLPDLKRPMEDDALVIHCGSMDALGVYELGVELVRARGNSLKPAFVVVADELRRDSGVEHPLWTNRTIAQPLSALNLLAVVEA